MSMRMIFGSWDLDGISLRPGALPEKQQVPSVYFGFYEQSGQRQRHSPRGSRSAAEQQSRRQNPDARTHHGDFPSGITRIQSARVPDNCP
jgi:hypothetical protein